MAKLSNKKKEEMREMYQSGNFTRLELSRAFSVSRQTVDNVLRNVKKPFKYDAMNIAVSLDQLKEKGKEIADWSNEPLSLLTKEPEYVKIVTCPQCTYKTTANKLLVHLVKHHKRFDLEYLL